MQALSLTEDRAAYRIVRKGQDLEQSYKSLAAHYASPAAANVDIHTRIDAVTFIMEQIDLLQEDREIAGVAMHHLDRFVALQFQSVQSSLIGEQERICAHAHAHAVHKTDTDRRGQSHANVLARNNGKYCLAMYCLVALDLAIRLHSPTSGDALRNAVQRVSDHTDLDPSATYSTVNNDISESLRTSALDEQVSGRMLPLPLPCREKNPLHIDLFIQETKKEFYGERIYHSSRFSTLTRISGHGDLEDFAQAQSILIGTLDFYLHPVLPTTFVTYMLQFLEHDLANLVRVNSSSSPSSSLEREISVLDYITSFAQYQVELSHYSVKFANVRPSLIAFAAVSNVMKIMLRGKSSVLRKKLAAFCEGITDRFFDSKSTRRVRHALFHLWKETYPRSIQDLQEDSQLQLHVHSPVRVHAHDVYGDDGGDDDNDGRKDFDVPRANMSKVQDHLLASPDTFCDFDTAGERKRPKLAMFETGEGLEINFAN